jgi:hypothetical protein
MRIRGTNVKCLIGILVFVMVFPCAIFAQGQGEEKPFKQEELDQLLAPIALYPDSLLTQVLMASTYPLEVVQAERWAKQNKDLKGDALTTALEKQEWDPSVKSLVNFPQVLAMMSEKLDMTQKLGDAFLAQEKDVMDTIQKLRAKAQESGNLKTTKEQTVIIEKETKTIIIESANPQVIYVPSYNATVVYGVWAYPAYPPYPYYPPGYGAAAFATGVAVGAAWGYAWGHSDWHGGDVDIDVNRNTNINNNINRDKYKQQYQGKGQGGQGKWQHDPSHRKGASYRDQKTAQKYNRGTSSDVAKSRDSFRGRTEQGSKDLSRGTGDRGSLDRGARTEQRTTSQRGGRDNAFSGDQRGSQVRQQSDRGRSSRQTTSSRTSGRTGGGRGGGRR